ncbi:MAG: right-handed parallel beta-helix repeat-containing protein, partial [Thermoplasmata archaeon]
FPDERITPRDGLESMYPEIVCDSNDNAQMVWVDDEGDTRNSIFYMRFNGDTWQNKTIISDTGGHGATDAKLTVDLNDQVHSIFHESIGNWYGRMYYCKINGSNGQVVIPYKNITAATHFIDDEQSVSDMAADSSNRIHAVGRFHVNSEFATYIVLDDNGTLLNYDTNVKAEKIAIDIHDNIHMSYIENNDIYYYRYKNGSWDGFKKLTNGTGQPQRPDLEADIFGDVHLVFGKYGEGIFYRKFYSSNATWGTKLKLLKDSWLCSMGSDGTGNLHIAYRAYSRDINYTKFDYVTSTWSGFVSLTLQDSPASIPVVAADSNSDVYVVWYDYRDENNEELYWARYRSSPFVNITQPDGTNVTLSMSQTDGTGMNFTTIFYPTQDGIHYVNATGIDLAGNIGYNTTSFEALVPPFVTDPAPRGGAHTTDSTPTITAALWDYSGVDVGTVILMVNGTNVTGLATITPTSIDYTPSQDLWVGPINVSIICADMYGNAMKVPYNWTFFIDLEPPPPTDLTLSLSDDDVVLSWTAPDSPDIVHYLIYKSYSLDGFNFSSPYHNTSGDPSPLSTTWTDFDAASNWTKRYYIVRVVDKVGKNDSNQNAAGNGDWVVVTEQYHGNLDIILNGNLSIKPDGALTLDNVTLKMNSTSAVRFEISIAGKFSTDTKLVLLNGSNLTSISSYKYDIDVGSYGRFVIENSTVTQGRNLLYDQNSRGSVSNGTIDFFDRMDVRTDRLTINASLLKKIDESYIYDPVITNNTITECDRFTLVGGSNSKAFIAFNNFIKNGRLAVMWGARPTIYNNTISEATSYGIYLYQSDPIIEKNILVNNPVGIYLNEDPSPTITNSTIIGGIDHFRLDGESHPVTLNTTFDRNKIQFDDAESTLTIKWYMHVFVRDIKGDLIEGAQVTVFNATGGNPQIETTDSDGFIRWLVCPNSTVFSTHTTYYDPYNVTALWEALTGYAEPGPVMNMSRQVNVTLGTDLPPKPPINLSIEISFDTLVLKWGPSPSVDLSHYLIYRAASPEDLDFSVPWVNTSLHLDPQGGNIIPLRTSWNDTGAAAGTWNLFYVVRAVDSAGQNDSNTYIMGKFVISLVSGWNLISLPLVQKDTALSSVLAPIAGQYNVVEYFNASDNNWHMSDSDLEDVYPYMAMWIHMKSPADLKMIGNVPENTSIQLVTSAGGWNFIGYPCFAETTVVDAFSSIAGKYDRVRMYDAHDTGDPWKSYITYVPANMNDLALMKPGYGYWVHVTEDCVLTPGN